MIGPGKYDDLCTIVRERENADAACVIIFNGKRGSGFSMQVEQMGDREWAALALLPDVLRKVADEIQKDAESRHSARG